MSDVSRHVTAVCSICIVFSTHTKGITQLARIYVGLNDWFVEIIFAKNVPQE
jgi:hypothetical protein